MHISACLDSRCADGGSEVEVDGSHTGGYILPASRASEGVERRLSGNQTDTRSVVIVKRVDVIGANA